MVVQCANKGVQTTTKTQPKTIDQVFGMALTHGVIECANKSMQTKTKTQPKSTDQVLRTALTQGVIECVCRVVKRGFAFKSYFAVH